MTTTINEHVETTLTDEDKRLIQQRREREAQKEHYEAWVSGQDIEQHEAEVRSRYGDAGWSLLCIDPYDPEGSLLEPTHKVVNQIGQTVFTFGSEAAATAYAVEYHLTVEAL